MNSKVYWVFLGNHWPESSALGNAADFCLTTLPMVLPQKNVCFKFPNLVRNAKKFLEAMPLAMLPTKSLPLPRPDGLGLYLSRLET